MGVAQLASDFIGKTGAGRWGLRQLGLRTFMAVDGDKVAIVSGDAPDWVDMGVDWVEEVDEL